MPLSASLIPLTRGTFTIVNTELLRTLNLHRWYLSFDGRKKRYVRRSEQGRTIYMHREIMNPPKGMEVDHINGNGLDNRRENLRLCTKTQNQQNANTRIFKTSIFKGVSWHKSAKKWRAQIRVKGRLLHIGYSSSEVEAAEAYDKEAIYYFGEFAKINFKGVTDGNKDDTVIVGQTSRKEP